jgi:hypothetical protein
VLFCSVVCSANKLSISPDKLVCRLRASLRACCSVWSDIVTLMRRFIHTFFEGTHLLSFQAFIFNDGGVEVVRPCLDEQMNIWNEK